MTCNSAQLALDVAVGVGVDIIWRFSIRAAKAPCGKIMLPLSSTCEICAMFCMMPIAAAAPAEPAVDDGHEAAADSAAGA
eukprot:1608989-Lingulodinium_polyedra.AAC.1